MKQRFLRLWQNAFFKPKLGLRILLVILSLFAMGAAMSVIEKLHFGTDPYLCMCIGIADRTGILVGTVSLLILLCLFILVFIADVTQIGIGTFCNMIGYGYIVDLFRFVWKKVGFTGIESLPLRILILVLALAVFILAVAVYLSADLGGSPYDGAPVILSEQMHLSFTFIRMSWDITATIIGILLGGTFGAVTVVCALFVGPAVTLCRRVLDPLLQ